MSKGFTRGLVVPFRPAERRAIYLLARQRARFVKDATVERERMKKYDPVRLNAIGLAAEVAWARYFGVPFWHNDQDTRGDEGFGYAGDLELRDGSWAEVKGSTNGRELKLWRPVSRAVDHLLYGHWVRKHGELHLVGCLPRDRVSAQKLPASIWKKPAALRVVAFDGLPRPGARRPMERCPWCITGPWPCEKKACLSSLDRREASTL